MIKQLNAAKNRLRTILHRELYKPVDSLMEHSCNAKEKTVFAYFKALHATKAWPMERIVCCSIDELVGKLSRFSISAPVDTASCANHPSSADLRSTVDDALHDTERHFDGLCLGELRRCILPHPQTKPQVSDNARLDCMHASKVDTMDADYWRHAQPGMPYTRGCRTTHGQPSWYHSFVSREASVELLWHIN